MGKGIVWVLRKWYVCPFHYFLWSCKQISNIWIYSLISGCTWIQYVLSTPILLHIFGSSFPSVYSFLLPYSVSCILFIHLCCSHFCLKTVFLLCFPGTICLPFPIISLYITGFALVLFIKTCVFSDLQDCQLCFLCCDGLSLVLNFFFSCHIQGVYPEYICPQDLIFLFFYQIHWF